MMTIENSLARIIITKHSSVVWRVSVLKKCVFRSGFRKVLKQGFFSRSPISLKEGSLLKAFLLKSVL